MTCAPTGGPQVLELAEAVSAFNRAAAELEIARRLLRRTMAAEAAVAPVRRANPPCGTRGRYARHLRRDEVPDPACVEANTWDRDRFARGRSA